MQSGMDKQDGCKDAVDAVSITLTHHGSTHTLDFPHNATLADVAEAVQRDLSVPVGNQKYLVPKVGLQKAPFGKDGGLPLSLMAGQKIKLIGATVAEVASVNSASEQAAQQAAARLAAQRKYAAPGRASPRRQAGLASISADGQYGFLQIRPLAKLPNPQRSRAFLDRLAADPGIVAAMRKHRFSVALLTEMDPLTHTAAGPEGTTRTLGLNRNRGEVIELRLRTDAYDGYRAYRVIRDTLCHELAHNVHSDHDRAFWDLCRQIEREVARADWTAGGRSLVGGAEYYEARPSSGERAYDDGGWTGGEYVLGGGGGPGGSAADGAEAATPLSRREVMAKAAEERHKREQQQGEEEEEERESAQ